MRTRVGCGTAVALLGLGALLLALARLWGPPGPVYTVAQVAAGLSQQPQAWEGRTVTVRGVAVLIEWAIQHHGVPMGMARVGCTDGTGCTLHVPPNTFLHVFLVGHAPRGRAAYAHLLTALTAARASPFASATPNLNPPNLVLLVLPPRLQLADALLLLRVVPRPLVDLVAGPVSTSTPPPVATALGGTPRLYRVHLWPATALRACSGVCEDGALAGSP